MTIGDFYVLYHFNVVNNFNHLGQISALNRHQRHQDFGFRQDAPWATPVQVR